MVKTTVVQADLIARDKASPVFDKFGRRVRDTTKSTNLLTRSATGLVKAFGSYVAISSAVNFLADANKEAREAQKINAVTAQSIQHTGGVANVTAKQVGNLANAISRKAGIDDEAVQSGANLLLTFRRVRNEVGAGGKIFDRATQAAVDLSARGFGSIETTSKQLGKALEDPVKGVTALRRAGVQLSESQTKQIEKFVEQNDLLSAQKIILKEVEAQVGGTAAAQATAGDRAKVAWQQAKEVIGTALLPAVDAFSNAFANKAVPAAEKFSDWIKSDGIPLGKEFGGAVKEIGGDALPILADGAKLAVGGLKLIAPIVSGITDALGALPSGARNMVLLGGAAALMGSKFRGSSLDLIGWARNADQAALKTTALRGGALVGATALGALSPKAHETSRSLGILTDAAAGATLGFAVGGPWGAAIGGAGGALVGFMRKTDKTAATVNKNKQSNLRYADSFDAITGKATKATRALVATDLMKGGVFKLGARLGVEADLLVDAAIGLKGAEKRLRAAIAEGLSKTGDEAAAIELLNKLGLVEEAYNQSKTAAEEFNNAVEGRSPKIDVEDHATPKLQATEAQMREFEGWLVKMGVDADTLPAEAKARAFQAWLASQTPTVPVDAATDLAQRKGEDIISYINRLTGIVAINGDPSLARRKGESLKAWVNRIKASMKVDANTGSAQDKVNAFIRSFKNRTITIPIFGDFKFAGGGPVGRYAGGGIAGYPGGGAVRGPGGPKADRVPAMLSAGEHVFTAEEVRRMGGQAKVLAFRRAIRQSGGIQGFAGGSDGASQLLPGTGPVQLDRRTIEAIGEAMASALTRTARGNGDLVARVGRGR